ncbi:hypothetical protein ONS95_004290 [Cadophora gregata]|uniref:uncharacterized protein n=1 Tax=Cadophora gregata TaxID=51156 RepID=UPI0026DAC3DA|nr:uncharacterized protein ONS95_004290 [Cadophora gregata]KAK0105772.1 hypothetical protein ONS95_004290 [Cadophora gregata]
MGIMFAFAPMLGFLAVAGSQIATLSLGGLQQYNPPGAVPPTLTGTIIGVSGGTTAEEGVDIFFSPDLHALIQSSVEANCQQVSEQCLQSVTNLVSGPNTELQARQLLVSAFLVYEIVQFAIDVAIFLLAAAVAVAAAGNIDGHDFATHVSIPPAQLNQATSMVTATATVVMVDGVPPFTITPKPVPTAITGTYTPIATSFTSAVNGHNAGDIVISLPNDFSKRMEGFIRRSTDCAAANALDQPIAKRVDEFGPALCGAQGVIMNAVPGGPFADIRLMGIQPLPFAAAGAVRAMNAAMQFARNWAAQLQMTPEQAELFGVAVFAITELVNHQGAPLGTENTIPAESLSGTITQSQTMTSAPETSSSLSSSSSSSECTVCYASCSFVGIIQGCGTTCMQVSSCSSKTASNEEPDIITTATIPWYDAAFVPTQVPIVPSVPLEECTGGGSSFPYDSFSGAYGQFCAEIDKVHSSLNWNVDPLGNKIQALRRRDLSVVQRSPPVNPETWKDWRINLNWIVGDAPECTKSCSDAFKTLANSCR